MNGGIVVSLKHSSFVTRLRSSRQKNKTGDSPSLERGRPRPRKSGNGIPKDENKVPGVTACRGWTDHGPTTAGSSRPRLLCRRLRPAEYATPTRGRRGLSIGRPWPRHREVKSTPPTLSWGQSPSNSGLDDLKRLRCTFAQMLRCRGQSRPRSGVD